MPNLDDLRARLHELAISAGRALGSLDGLRDLALLRALPELENHTLETLPEPAIAAALEQLDRFIAIFDTVHEECTALVEPMRGVLATLRPN